MKKTFLATLFIFLILSNLKGQNWRTINSHRTSYFRMVNELYGLKPDSFLVDIKDTVFYPYSIRKTNMASIEPSWAGKKIIVKDNGWDLYLTNSDDTMFINTKAEENENWKFYKENNGNYYSASLIKKSKEDLGGMEDSVKLFTLHYKDQNDQPLSSDFNNYQFKFSKNNGLILCSYLLNFPALTDSLKLAGVDSLFGVQNIKEREIYNFEVGDIFHYHSFGIDYGQFEYFQIDTIISKLYTQNNDSVKYIVARNKYNRNKYDGPPGEFMLNSFTKSVQTIGISYFLGNQNNYLKDLPLIWYTCTTGQYHVSNYNNRSYFDNTFNNRNLRYYNQSDMNNHSGLLGEGIGIIKKFEFLETNEYDVNYNLLYYKKGTETWGKPIKGDSLLALSITNGIDISHDVTVSPNPFSESCLIHFQNDKSNSLTCILTDLSGRELRRFSTSSDHLIIEKENLNKGVYLLKINDEEGRYANKKLIID